MVGCEKFEVKFVRFVLHTFFFSVFFFLYNIRCVIQMTNYMINPDWLSLGLIFLSILQVFFFSMFC